MFERKAKSKIIKGFDNSRITLINGARQCGKTTLVKQTAEEKNINYITLDDPQKLQAAKSDPQNFIDFYSSPIIIDEIQYAPELIPYIKQKVDTVNEKGMYLLTGSSDFYKNVRITESLAGRMLHYELYNLSVAEINNYSENIIELMFADNISELVDFSSKFKDKSFNNFIQRIISGGFPEVQNLDKDISDVWFKSYLESRILKDADIFFDIKKNNRMLDLVTVLAANNSNLLNTNTIAKKLQLDFKTVQKYISLLEAMFIIKQVPNYSENIVKQVIKQKKLHFSDTGLASSVLNISKEKLISREENYLGQLTENYIYTELQKQSSFVNDKVNIYHFRDLRKNEVDFILKNSDNKTIAVEVKSKSVIGKKDIAGILKFAENYKGDLFRAYVFYSGNEIIPVANNQKIKIYLLPAKMLS
ncbi:MAG: ATP-binding protein [Bacteroidales bacterium]|nr:ATP-binding protein [Bacteroidales bacterium]